MTSTLHFPLDVSVENKETVVVFLRLQDRSVEQHRLSSTEVVIASKVTQWFTML